MEKSLKCPQCAFRAKMKSNLNSHVKNVHGATTLSCAAA